MHSITQYTQYEYSGTFVDWKALCNRIWIWYPYIHPENRLRQCSCDYSDEYCKQTGDAHFPRHLVSPRNISCISELATLLVLSTGRWITNNWYILDVYYQRNGFTRMWLLIVCTIKYCWVELIWLFNVTINDISVIYVTAHRCAGGLKKKFDLRSGSHAIDIS